MAENNEELVETETVTPEVDFKPISVRTEDGGLMQINDLNELHALFSSAKEYGDYYRKNIIYESKLQAIESNKITDEDLSLLIEAKKGNKSAITRLVKDAKLSVFDLDDSLDKEFKVPEHIKPAEETANQRKLTKLRKQQGFRDTEEIIESKFDVKSREQIYNNLDMLGTIHRLNQNGTLTAILDKTGTAQMFDSFAKPTLDYFIDAFKDLQKQAESVKTAKPTSVVKPTTTRSMTPPATSNQDDLSKMSFEQRKAYFDKKIKDTRW